MLEQTKQIPEIPGCEIAVQGNEITITKYVGAETEVDLPREIQSGMMVFLVTSIGDEAFADCTSLTICTPPNSVAWRYAEKNSIEKHKPSQL